MLHSIEKCKKLSATSDDEIVNAVLTLGNTFCNLGQRYNKDYNNNLHGAQWEKRSHAVESATRMLILLKCQENPCLTTQEIERVRISS